jgi:isoquinoline 1-oxidoreductase alpha subunit
VQLDINGKQYEVKAQADESLLQVLRDELDLTGSKYGCGEGACGACTVLLDGAATRSCITSVGSTIGKTITTIEGLAPNGKLHKVQEAFLKADVFQCAYCAPGMIMSATALLEKNPHPSPSQIVRAMQGNVCRCGTHPRIIDAIEIASKS